MSDATGPHLTGPKSTGPDGDPIPPAIEWIDGRVRMIDQRLLPGRLAIVEVTTVEDLCEAIRTLAVRGAPALGAAGAMGIALASVGDVDLDDAARLLKATRPTAVNLAWGVDRARAAPDPVAEAVRLTAEIVEANRRLATLGAALIPDGARILTHCNAGALACVGYGTALGVIRAAADAGRVARVWVDETRPLLQGARLTAWELGRLGIPHTVIVDSAAASLMAKGEVDCVVVGADRIAANGDVANKIGTYALAVLAHHHGIGFHVAAPCSTIDIATPDGVAISIEDRSGDEVRLVGRHEIMPASSEVVNPAFDVTPAALVSSIVTEAGVALPPFPESLAALVADQDSRATR